MQRQTKATEIQAIKPLFKRLRDQGYRFHVHTNNDLWEYETSGKDLRYILNTTESYLIKPNFKRADAIGNEKFDKLSAHLITPLGGRPPLQYFVQLKFHYCETDSLALATHIAWYCATGAKKFRPLCEKTLETEIHAYWENHVNIHFDSKYSEVAGILPSITPVMAKTVKLERLSYDDWNDSLNPALYEEFKKIMDELVMTRNAKANYLRSMGNTRPKAAAYHYKRTLWSHIITNKRQLTVQQWLENDKVSVIGYQFPKVGTPKSDGTLRTVVSVDPGLEAWQRKYFQGVTPVSLKGYISSPHDLPECDGYLSYDIKNCDSRAGPYFRKWVEERDPKNAGKLYPYVTDGESIYRPKSLPSGVLHTAIVVNAFTKAVMHAVGFDQSEYVFQGDGFLSKRAPSKFTDWFRRTEDGLNGFVKNKGIVRFQRTHKLKEPVVMRKGMPCGALRYAIRYMAYEILNAKDLHLYRKPDTITEGELMEAVKAAGPMLTRAERIAFGIPTYDCSNNEWDCDWNVEKVQDTGDFYWQ